MTAAGSYEASAARVEEIIRRLDTGAASLSETLELVKEGKDLIEHCARELEAVGDALDELRLEDLVARLERDGAGAGVRDATGARAGGRDAADAGAGGGSVVDVDAVAANGERAG